MRAGSKRVARVVVNADDFGLHESINDGIIRAHRDGIVTSASLIACGRAFEDALVRCRSCPEMGLGVHLTLVEERPVASAEKVPSLVDRDEIMPKSYREFARGWASGKIQRRDVQTELEAQVERVLESGIRPSHLDSHQQVHCLPGVWKFTLDLAEKYAVPFVRLPAFDSVMAEVRSPMLPVIRVGVNLMAALRRRANARSVKFADHVRGFAFSGRMTTSRLLTILETLRPGLTEVMVHPALPDEDLRCCYQGWRSFNWESEFRAVTDPIVVARCRQGDFTLTSFARA